MANDVSTSAPGGALLITGFGQMKMLKNAYMEFINNVGRYSIFK